MGCYCGLTLFSIPNCLLYPDGSNPATDIANIKAGKYRRLAKRKRGQRLWYWKWNDRAMRQPWKMDWNR